MSRFADSRAQEVVLRLESLHNVLAILLDRRIDPDRLIDDAAHQVTLLEGIEFLANQLGKPMPALVGGTVVIGPTDKRQSHADGYRHSASDAKKDSSANRDNDAFLNSSPASHFLRDSPADSSGAGVQSIVARLRSESPDG
ncbi:MAG: hypothetical protein R3C02_05595 [Planctomycetaceae bacterium]